MRMKRKYFSAIVGLVCICAGSEPAFGQSPEERAGARAAADQGFDAFGRGEWAVALDLFERAESLVHSPVHVLFQARCQAKLNRLIEAQEAYLLVLRYALPAGAPAAVRRAAQQDAQRELAVIEPQVPWVSVSVEGADGAEPVEITQDGRVLPPALLGVERPVNPGEHTWLARSGSRRSEIERRVVQTGTRSTVTLRLLEPEIELVSTPPRGALAGAAAARSAGYRADEGSHGPSAWVYVGFGVAAAGLGVGTGFLLQKGNIEDRIRDSCDPTGCYATPQNVERKSDADRAGLIATVGFISAGVGLTGALALWLLSPSDGAPSADPAPSARAPRLEPWLGWGSAGVTGSF